MARVASAIRGVGTTIPLSLKTDNWIVPATTRSRKGEDDDPDRLHLALASGRHARGRAALSFSRARRRQTQSHSHRVSGGRGRKSAVRHWQRARDRPFAWPAGRRVQAGWHPDRMELFARRGPSGERAVREWLARFHAAR